MIIGIVCLILGWTGGIFFGCVISDKHWKDQAVSNNVAEYYLDNGYLKKWRWK